MALETGARCYGFWYEEQVTEELLLKMSLRKILFEGESKFQRVQVVETAPFGKTLVLDDHTQSAELDERSYHEALVHPAMLAHGAPKRVFIGGGGEGATAREVLKWKSVEKVVMVDLDEIACKQCRDHLPTWNAGVYEDPRFEIHYEDALAFLKNYSGEPFDVVIMDISDPIECGPGIELYFKGFYEMLARDKMSEGAVFVTQSGACGMLNYEEVFTTIHSTARSSFTNVHGYAADIPCFGCPWGFNMGYNTCNFPDVPNWSPENVDARLADALKGSAAQDTFNYDGISHRNMFALPKYVRSGCAAEKRVMCKETPVFLT